MRWQITFFKIEFYAVCESQRQNTEPRRLYSPSLKDVGWIEDAELIFLIFHTFVCKFGRVEGAAREKNYRQMYEKLEKLTERLLSNLHSSNLVNTIFYLAL